MSRSLELKNSLPYKNHFPTPILTLTLTRAMSGRPPTGCQGVPSQMRYCEVLSLRQSRPEHCKSGMDMLRCGCRRQCDSIAMKVVKSCGLKMFAVCRCTMTTMITYNDWNLPHVPNSFMKLSELYPNLTYI